MTAAWDLSLSAFASDFDGETWFAADRNSVLAFDTLDSRLRVMWRVDRLDEAVLAIGRAGRVMWFCLGQQEPEYWGYELPKLVLRDRWRPALNAESVLRLGFGTGAVAAIQAGPEPDRRLDLTSYSAKSACLVAELPISKGSPSLEFGAPVVGNGWFAVPTFDAGRLEVRLVAASAKPLGYLAIDDACGPFVSRHGAHLVLGDRRGRLVVADMESLRIARNARF